MFFFSKIPSLRIEGTVFHVFDKVKVKITLDSSNLQHQKIRMALVEPQVRPSLTYWYGIINICE
jgi:exosome complex exonuclease DIS3/RRP44